MIKKTKENFHCTTSNVVNVTTGIFFVLITELCLGFYLYRYVIKENNEIHSNFPTKIEMQEYFFTLFKSETFRREVAQEMLKKIMNMELKSIGRRKRDVSTM